jgi:hypothetical protein
VATAHGIYCPASRKRVAAFSLSLHPAKTRVIEFGRHAAVNRKKRGVSRPETFAFLGFTFICGYQEARRLTATIRVPRRPVSPGMVSERRKHASSCSVSSDIDRAFAVMREAAVRNLVTLPTSLSRHTPEFRLVACTAPTAGARCWNR